MANFRFGFLKINLIITILHSSLRIATSLLLLLLLWVHLLALFRILVAQFLPLLITLIKLFLNILGQAICATVEA